MLFHRHVEHPHVTTGNMHAFYHHHHHLACPDQNFASQQFSGISLSHRPDVPCLQLCSSHQLYPESIFSVVFLFSFCRHASFHDGLLQRLVSFYICPKYLNFLFLICSISKFSLILSSFWIDLFVLFSVQDIRRTLL